MKIFSVLISQLFFVIFIASCASESEYLANFPKIDGFEVKKVYRLNRNMFTLAAIRKNFLSVHNKDYFLIILVVVFGFSIDGLYGMGHFLSFGIAIISAIQFFTPQKISNNKRVNSL